MSTVKSEMNLTSTKDEVVDSLKCATTYDANEFAAKFSWLSSKELEYKGLIEQAFRECLLKIISSDTERLKMHVQLSIDLCRLDLCGSSLPVCLLSDIFEMSTLDLCEKIFNFVEVNVYTWKEPLFFASCKNSVLRMCNDLLRRLSRSQNTVFCGRILLFLAQFFPFSERSGLNIVSEFNIENITDFNNEADLVALMDEEVDEPDTDMKIKVDFSLYSKFWYLQNFFRSPNDLYTNQKWMIFTTYAKVVLTALQHYKLEDGTGNAYMTALKAAGNNDNHYFAKFLTSQKLLELQLSDSNFRRYVLVQFLILFQYLTSTVKSKPDSYVLKTEQNEWINVYKSMIYELIEETPPDGVQFLSTVQRMLQREERWNEWKNKSCPEIKKPVSNTVSFDVIDKRRERHFGDIQREYLKRNKYYMGQKSLSVLWNSKPDNIDACKSADRDFLPSLEDYFKIAIEQADPSAMIEPQYLKVKESDYAWRGLRLLSQKSSHFYTAIQNPNVGGEKIPRYLGIMCDKIAQNRPLQQGQEKQKPKIEIVETDSPDEIIPSDGVEEGEVVNDENDDIQNDETIMMDENIKNVISKEALDKVAKTITKDWQKLGLKMGYHEDEMTFFEKERPVPSGESRPTPEENARYILQIWSEDDDDPSYENLLSMLESLNLPEAIDALKGTRA